VPWPATPPRGVPRPAALRVMRKRAVVRLPRIPSTPPRSPPVPAPGTTRQFRDAMMAVAPRPPPNYSAKRLAHSGWDIAQGRRVIKAPPRRRDGKGGMLGTARRRTQHPGRRLAVGAGAVVSQVLAASRAIDVPDEVLLFQVPVRAADGTVLFGPGPSAGVVTISKARSTTASAPTSTSRSSGG